MYVSKRKEVKKMKVPFVEVKAVTVIKEVENCRECPYCYTIQDMCATIPFCRLKDNTSSYSDAISGNYRKVIDKNCPLRNKEEK